MIKILHVTKRFEKNKYGGVETLIENLCDIFNNNKFTSDVYTLSENITKKKKYKIFSEKKKFEILSTPLPIKGLKNFFYISREYDFINFHFPWPFMDLLSFFIPKKKIIITYHADIYSFNPLFILYLPLMLFFLSRSNKIIVTSKAYLNSSLILKLFKKKVKIIPIGIKKPIFSFKIKKKIFRLKNSNYLIFVGSLRGYKGIGDLIKASKKIKNGKLVIAGDGPERHKVIQHINAEKKNNIIFFPNLSNNEKFFLMNFSRGLVLPSLNRREAFGIVLVEASALKKPLITYELNSGTSFVNKNKMTGRVVDLNNIDKLAAAMNLFLYEEQKKYSLNSFKNFNKNFTLKKMKLNYENFYKSL